MDFRSTTQVRITKRLTDGTYTSGRVLSHGGACANSEGDVVATGGRWWAVWSSSLARTLWTCSRPTPSAGSPRPPAHHTPLWDSAWLALTPGSVFPLNLVWVRGNTEGESATPTDLRRALGSAAGTWSSSTLATIGVNNFMDIAVVRTTTYLTWIRDGRAMYADNASGVFVSRRFLTPVIEHGRSHVAVSGGVVYGGWTATVNQAFVASQVWRGLGRRLRLPGQPAPVPVPGQPRAQPARRRR